jgi:hypothetical protein
MNHSRIVTISWGVALLLVLAYSDANALVTNPGFEGPLNYVVDWPNEHDRWGGDMAEAVSEPHNGIVAYEGQRMLRFEASNTTGWGTTQGCQVLQVLDVSEQLDLIQSGDALAVATAHFNRVSGDGETDTEFAVRLFAYSGTVNQHSNLKEAGAHLLRRDTVLYSDSYPDTWEVATVKMWLPAETDFLVVELAANENVYNDYDPPEFDGHYADAVIVAVVPEPSTLLLLAPALVSFATMLRKKFRGAVEPWCRG